MNREEAKEFDLDYYNGHMTHINDTVVMSRIDDIYDSFEQREKELQELLLSEYPRGYEDAKEECEMHMKCRTCESCKYNIGDNRGCSKISIDAFAVCDKTVCRFWEKNDD